MKGGWRSWESAELEAAHNIRTTGVYVHADGCNSPSRSVMDMYGHERREAVLMLKKPGATCCQRRAPVSP